MPREAALVNMADEILVAGRFFEEDNQPEAILGATRQGPGLQHPQEAIGNEVTVEAADCRPRAAATSRSAARC